MLPFVFAFYPLCLSGIALFWLLRTRSQSWFNWAIRALACSSVMAFAFLTGPWAFTSYYLRHVLFALFLFTMVYSYRRIKRDEVGASAGSAGRPIFSTLTLLLFSVLDTLAIASHYQPGESLNLSFPFASGTYYVLQGGNNEVTNPFHALSGNKLALDIVKLNRYGNRADGIAPRALRAYQIFGERLYSPCEGRVLAIRNNLPDNDPGETDTEHPEGNYIVLKCVDTEVFMAHLMQGSIAVAQGEVVTVGQRLAEIGNSGNTLEPHLHIGAKKGGMEIELRFNGRSLSVNSVVVGRNGVGREPSPYPDSTGR